MICPHPANTSVGPVGLEPRFGRSGWYRLIPYTPYIAMISGDSTASSYRLISARCNHLGCNRVAVFATRWYWDTHCCSVGIARLPPRPRVAGCANRVVVWDRGYEHRMCESSSRSGRTRNSRILWRRARRRRQRADHVTTCMHHGCQIISPSVVRQPHGTSCLPVHETPSRVIPLRNSLSEKALCPLGSHPAASQRVRLRVPWFSD